MASTFALVLLILTIITGIFWCLEHFKWAPERRIRIEELRKQMADKVDAKVLTECARRHPIIENTASFFPILLFIFVVRSFIYEPYQIPSGSMMPTLLIGDFILVEKFAYGINNPITNAPWIKLSEPKRGDIIVFKYPKDPSIDYIKRVVGLPGDKIIYDTSSKQLTIYPKCGDQSIESCAKLSMSYSDVQRSDFVQSFQQVTGGYRSDFFTLNEAKKIPNLMGAPLLQQKEALGDKTHNILILPLEVGGDSATNYYHQDGQNLSEWVVPEGQYFAMGDNRDNSADSRYWGFVPEQNLVGKAQAIWFSFEKHENQWPTGVRLRRIGAIK